MSFAQAITDGFTKYATFDGRSRRSAYWYWVLFTAIVYAVAIALDRSLGITIEGAKVFGTSGVGWLSLAALLVLAIPSIAVTIRRLHDAGHSGWWWLFAIICGIGAIVVFIFCLIDSKPDNQWGPNPKASPIS